MKISIRTTLVAAMLAVVAGSTVVQAQIVNQFVARTHSSVYDTIVYRLHIPTGYTAATKYPLIVSFHGVGERGTDNTAQLNNNLVTAWVADTNQANHPCFVVAPQCPGDAQWADFPWSPGIYRVQDYTESNVMKTVLSMLDSLKREFSIDTNRMYATGLSMGGCGTWDLIARHPGMFAAAVPVCGVGDSLQAGIFGNIPIWAFHGAVDGVVPPTGTRYPMSAIGRTGNPVLRVTSLYNGSSSNITMDSLSKRITAGQRHIYTEYTDGSHFIWDNSFLNPLLPAWLFSKSKDMTGASQPGRAARSLPSIGLRVTNRTVDIAATGSFDGVISTLAGAVVARTSGTGPAVWHMPSTLAPGTYMVRVRADGVVVARLARFAG